MAEPIRYKENTFEPPIPGRHLDPIPEPIGYYQGDTILGRYSAPQSDQLEAISDADFDRQSVVPAADPIWAKLADLQRQITNATIVVNKHTDLLRNPAFPEGSRKSQVSNSSDREALVKRIDDLESQVKYLRQRMGIHDDCPTSENVSENTRMSGRH